jgi:protein-L-isoaspartate(D-aspartate) O-methyltransferase
MTRNDASQTLRNELVERLRQSGTLTSSRVARAFRRVPRHVFVPEHPQHAVYDDRALITKARGGIPTSSSSQPAIMATMLEQLEVRPGQRVLEIGAGTGYNAALLSEIAGSRGSVTSIDIQPDVAAIARARLRALRYDNVRVVADDGARGYAKGAPFDRIIVTASCWEMPSAWLHQLRDGGVIVLPLRLNGSHVSLGLRRRGDVLRGISAQPCGFMPMQGVSGRTLNRRLTGGVAPMFAQTDARIPLVGLRTLLRTTPQRVECRALDELKPGDVFNFATFQALQGDPVVAIGAIGGAQDVGLCDEGATSLCFAGTSAVTRGRLIVYGGDEMRAAFERNVQAFVDAGKPATTRLRVDIRANTAAALDEIPKPVGRGRYAWARASLRFDARYAAA